MKAIEDRDNLIKVLDEYIRFLGQELDSNAGFLSTHGIFTDEDTVRKGREFRNKIKELKDFL